MSAKFVEDGNLLFFLRLGGAMGAPTLGGLWNDDEASTLFCFVLDAFVLAAFVLAITSGSCSGKHAVSVLHSFCALPVDNVIVLNWEYLFELGVDVESKEFEDNAVTDAAFTRACSGNDPRNQWKKN